ncbi:T6SS effector BTH_I2691 family protein [Dyella sp. ASV21]|uniref:T6SS effector BTH_I2691 family protein n=1 Tax=Dyella sp. ASV21 TaxID=2795114 RepID=UPI0018EE3624|nr:T6SS effector BTH_I2691 family protein [Dyella sp. ASV21]
MSTSQALNTVVAESSRVQAGVCRACKRKGLPILPLRRVLAPALGDKTPMDRPGDIAWREDALRTLREGYLYVLLDKREWQAYEVTAEGHLRQFDPYEMPRDQPAPLTLACTGDSHDIPSSFLNIDTGKYKKAQVAFASDPWPASVLDSYRKAGAPPSRFTLYDLAALKEDPSSVNHAMAFSQANDLSSNVWEYAPTAPDFSSVHGIYPRHQRMAGTQAFASLAAKQHALTHGLPVLLLPDPVGLVQEYNALRLRQHQAAQAWAASEERPLKLFTSQALLGIKELEAHWAQDEAKAEVKAQAEHSAEWNSHPFLMAKAPMPGVDVPAETQRVTKHKTTKQHSRLEERYSEPDRAAFQADYDKGMQAHQAAIDKLGARYEQHASSAAFQLVMRHDYASTRADKATRNDDAASALAYTCTVSACLAGGPTGALPQPGKELEPTQRLWQTLLEDRGSMLYKALLAKDQTLLEQIPSDLSGESLDKLYDTISTLIGSTQGQRAMVEPIQRAVAQLLAATSNACNALVKHLQPVTQQWVGHIHSAAFLRYSGQWITETKVTLRVGEYLTLLGETLHEKADELLHNLNKNVAQPAARQVRAMVLSGALTVAVARNNTDLITVTVWVLDKAEGVKRRVDGLAHNVRAGTQQGRRLISIGAATLERNAAQITKAMELGAVEARQFAGEAMHQLRRAGSASRRLGAAGPNVLLTLGSLWFQQDGLRKSLDAIAQAPGQGHNEAVAAVWSASIGVMGVGATLSGQTMAALYPQITTTAKVLSTTRLGLETKVMPVGARIAQFGGAITAVTGIVDGVGYAWAADRMGAQGDNSAFKAYFGAAAASALSAGVGLWAALIPEASLLGPLGLALILGLAAYAIAMWAKSEESSPLELWARHTLWGLPSEQRQWNPYTPEIKKLPAQERAALVSDFHNTAIAALNAAVLGLTAEVGIHRRLRVTQGSVAVGPMGVTVGSGDTVTLGPALQYAIRLPGYDPLAARYSWALAVTRHHDTQIIAAGRNDGAPLALQPPPRFADYDLTTTTPVVDDDEKSKPRTLSITGSIDLHSGHDITALALVVEYWPDKSDLDGKGKLTVIQSKLDTKDPK